MEGNNNCCSSGRQGWLKLNNLKWKDDFWFWGEKNENIIFDEARLFLMTWVLAASVSEEKNDFCFQWFYTKYPLKNCTFCWNRCKLIDWFLCWNRMKKKVILFFVKKKQTMLGLKKIEGFSLFWALPLVGVVEGNSTFG